MKILCDDKINMSVDVKWIGSFDITENNINIIKEKVPSRKVTEGDITGYQLSLSEFYKIAIKDIIRANSRAVVAPYKTDVIPEQRVEIEKSIRSLILSRLKELGYPVKTSDILVSNLDFDPIVTKTRQEIKQAELDDLKKAALAKATLAQASRNAEIARENGKALIETARAEAKANSILTRSLTPAVLQLRQWEAMERIGKGTNNELVIVPYNALGTNAVTQAVNRRTLRGTANQ
jgi:regulator of protease activity HflC (stomatin/prohibitin superfamily)